MSVEHLAAVLHHAKTSGSKKLLMLGIANHEGDGGAWPAISTLARYACIHPRNVQRALQELEAEGLIVVVHRGGRSNVYRTVAPCPDDCDRSPQHKRIDPTHGVSATPGASATPTYGVSATPPTAVAPPKPLTNHNYNQHSLAFDEFWETYPKKIAAYEVRQLWDTLTPEQQAQAVDGSRRYAESDAAHGDQRWILTPARFLREYRYLDEFPTTRKQKARTNYVEEPKTETAPIPKCIHDPGKSFTACYACTNAVADGTHPEIKE